MAAGLETEEMREEVSGPELPLGYNFPLNTVHKLEQLDRQLANNTGHRQLVSEYYNFFVRIGNYHMKNEAK